MTAFSFEIEAARLLGVQIRDFMESSDRERLRLFRLYLQMTVTRVSPIVVDLAAFVGSDFATIAEDLAPPRSWPELLVVRGSADVRSGDASSGLPRMRLASSVLNAASLRSRRPSGRRAANASLLVAAGTIDTRLVARGCAIRTRGEVADILLPTAVPDTVVAALPGRPIDVLLSHPLLDGRGYVVKRARSGTVTPLVVTICTGTLPACLPWGDLLAEQMGEPA